uniref:Ribosomal biogenesis protein LAS1L n=1 Tax=Elaeophora elaphi TaxID=1147741 RepID=A0A0R3RJX7_9BILA
MKDCISFSADLSITLTKYANRIVGIPQWVVDVRHSATHSHLPSLDSLRQAASYCRNWLWEHHWSRPVAEALGLNSNIRNENEENQVQETAIDLIDRFMLFSLQNMEVSVHKKNNRPDKNMKLQKILTKMETFIMMHPRQFLDTFLLEGYLILNEKQAKSIDHNLFAENDDIWNVPEDLQLFWKPIFHYLNEAKMLPELLFQLLEAASDSEIQSIRKRQLIAWSDRMLTAYVESNVLTQSEWERILKAVMIGPKELKEAYFDRVLKKIEKITEKEQSALRQLAILSSGKATTSETSTSQVSPSIASSVKTVKDLQQLMTQKENEKESGTKDSSSASSNTYCWATCNPLEWQGIPLGLTPEQSTESLYLVVELKVKRVRKRRRLSKVML